MSENQPGSDLHDRGEDKVSDRIESAAADPRPRHWIWRHKLIVAGGMLFSLGFGHYWLMHPVDNPNPQKKFVVRGSFPYDRGWDLRFDISYYTKNPTCKQTANAFLIFPQAEVTRGARRSVQVTREGDSQYRFEFYADALSPGFCEWTLRFVNYWIHSEGREIEGGALLGFPSNVNVINYRCKTVRLSTSVPQAIKTRVVCLDDKDRWRDVSRQDSLVNFIWQDGKK